MSQYILLDQFYMMPELITGMMLKATEDFDALKALEAKMKASGELILCLLYPVVPLFGGFILSCVHI